MKSIIAIFALMLSAHVFAADECAEVGQMYFSAATQRDQAIPQDAVTKNIRKNFASLSSHYNLELVVTAAFKHFDVAPQMLSDLAAAKCEDDRAQSVDENPAADAKPATPAPIVASGYSQAFDICVSKSNGVTVAMLDCIAAETSKQDGRLNKSYQATMAALPPNKRLDLRNAQRAWIKDRDSKCALDTDGGTAAQVNSASCVLDMTARRAKDLQAK
ncbi:lysozyme inhibitor LprI family protein [Paraburkholderia sp. SARCC-3016]|uniref:lysozyme inhibitor LprI family protein n=1 Tax=Paraburkholderia sp. SARCC-3016 TaxID=3058611 RepID=UPI002809FE74|nr:lysozyme inhibitor LprI family protein [Paraburkholderia sp. SARCC-3016]MDQ7977147.1 lysozyme inhibitor LprI family protein [Paraburkholderia sp. SARCC-3016]